METPRSEGNEPGVPDSSTDAPLAAPLLEFLARWQGRTASEQTPVPSLLFHYTDVSGLHGILNTAQLWATHAAYLNDRTELIHSIQLVQQLMEHRNGSSQLDGPLNCPADDVMLQVMQNLYRYIDIYTVCFCENGDLLSQWRAYGPQGGYALGFAGGGVSVMVGPRITLVPVIYGEEEQRQCLSDLVADWRATFRDVPPRESSPPVWGVGVLVFAEVFTLAAVAFKDAAFAEEREWRLVYRRLQLPDEGTGLQVAFRHRHGMLLPYVPITPLPHDRAESTPRLALEEITMGPRAEPQLAGYALEKFVQGLGYTPSQ